MKRIVSLILVALLTLSVFCFTGCGAVNDSEVSILWSGNGKVEVPNSLINSIERAMYIKHVEYKHYGANGSLATQLEQAKSALNAGCQVLVVELVSDNPLEILGSQIVAQQIVDAAKEKSVPVIFFNCAVNESVVNSYDKCVSITSDVSTIADVQGELIADYVKANFKDIDKNEDNKISATFQGINTFADDAVKKANELLATDDYKVSRSFFGEKLNLSVELSIPEIINPDLTKYELILTPDDVTALVVLRELQKSDYNTDKLTTQFVPIVTVGESVDYKEIVLAGRPENKDEYAEYYENNKFLVDLTAVEEEDLDAMIYTTINVIDAGRIAGTATEDRDAIAIAVASVVRNLVKGDDTFKGVASEVKEGEAPSVVVDGRYVKVRYIAYN